jgi:hypothetical protein
MPREMTQRDGYRIVKRGDVKRESVLLDCPVCQCVHVDELDVISMSRSGCCHDCEIEVADRNREKWSKGWRPDEPQLSEIRMKRLASPHSRVHI